MECFVFLCPHWSLQSSRPKPTALLNVTTPRRGGGGGGGCFLFTIYAFPKPILTLHIAEYENPGSVPWNKFWAVFLRSRKNKSAMLKFDKNIVIQYRRIFILWPGYLFIVNGLAKKAQSGLRFAIPILSLKTISKSKSIRSFIFAVCGTSKVLWNHFMAFIKPFEVPQSVKINIFVLIRGRDRKG